MDFSTLHGILVENQHRLFLCAKTLWMTYMDSIHLHGSIIFLCGKLLPEGQKNLIIGLQSVFMKTGAQKKLATQVKSQDFK